MPYFKITYESDTVEGLKTIQGNAGGNGAVSADANFDASIQPPPQLDDQNLDAFSGNIPAPPDVAEADTYSDANAFSQPPPGLADSSAINMSDDEQTPPPPMGDSSNDNDDDSGETQGEGFTPPPSTPSKNLKSGKKDSK